MGMLKIIALAYCVCTAAAAEAANTNVLTKAEQKTLNRASMKASRRLERTAVKTVEVPPVKAEASRATLADVPAVREVLSKAGVLANDVPAVLEAVARAGIATNDAIAVIRLSGTATPATAVMPVFERIGSVVTVTAYNYVFVWRDDKDMVFPDLATRQASRDTYFGGLEKQIAKACETNDLERVGMLIREYVDKWDNVYKVNRQPPGVMRRGF
jgi:hypothetical protein